MLKSMVRDALVSSVTCTWPLVNFQISQESIVPKASSPRSGSFPGARDVLKDPTHFGSGKIGVDDQTRFLLDERHQAVCSHLIADRSGPTVLPNNGMADGFTRLTVPNDSGLALVGDADGGNIFVADGRTANSVSRDTNLACPYFVRIVFDPSRLREKLGKFFLGNGDYFT